MIPGLRQEVYKMSLKNLVFPRSREAMKDSKGHKNGANLKRLSQGKDESFSKDDNSN